MLECRDRAERATCQNETVASEALSEQLMMDDDDSAELPGAAQAQQQQEQHVKVGSPPPARKSTTARERVIGFSCLAPTISCVTRF